MAATRNSDKSLFSIEGNVESSQIADVTLDNNLYTEKLRA